MPRPNNKPLQVFTETVQVPAALGKKAFKKAAEDKAAGKQPKAPANMERDA